MMITTALQAACVALNARHVSAQMSALFTLDPSCNGKNMDQILADSKSLLQAGIDATDDLLRAKLFLYGNTRANMKNMHNVFGTDYYSKKTTTGLNVPDQRSVERLQGNLKEVQTLLKDTVRPDRYYLMCSDSTFRTTTDAHDVDPSHPPNTPVRSVYSTNFVWYVPGRTDAAGRATVIARPRAQSHAGATLCDDQTAAETFRTPGISALSHTFNTIVLCDELFDPATALQTVAGLTASKPGRNGKVSDSLGNYRSLPGLFTHEVFHLLGTQYSEKPLIWHKPDGSQEPIFAVYNPVTTYNLAHTPGKFLNVEGAIASIETFDSPDPYRIFMEASLLTSSSWVMKDE